MRIALVLVLAGCVAAPVVSEPAPVPFSVLSLNIANGAGWTTPQARSVQREFIAARPADFVSLQEVDVAWSRSGSIDTAAAVLPEGTTIHGVAQEFEGGTYGVALWVDPRHTVLRIETLVIDDEDTEEPRAILVVDVRLEDTREIRVCATHLSTYGSRPAELRKLQLQRIREASCDVVAGDFNAFESEVGPQLPGLVNVTGDSIDAVRSRLPGTGSLIPTKGASDHEFAAFAVFE